MDKEIIKHTRIIRNIVAHEYLADEWIENMKKFLVSIPDLISTSQYSLNEVKKLIKKID